jgi:hypothetical protein
LDVGSELGGEDEYGVGCDVLGYGLRAFFLIANVDEAVVDAHFKLGGGLIPAPLVFVEFFQTLESVHQLLRLHRHWEILPSPLEMQRKNMKPCTSIMTLYRVASCIVLHREVVSHCSRTVTDEVEGAAEPTAREQVAEEVV